MRRPGVVWVLAWLLVWLLGLAPPTGRAMAALTLPTGFDSARVADGLDSPTAARFAPDGRLFILEKAGRVRVWKPETGLVAAPVVTLPVCDQSEMGLLGLAFDPQFRANGRLYLYHTQPPGGDPSRCDSSTGRENRIVRVTVSGDTVDLATLQVVFAGIRTDNGNHDGGNLEIGPDGFLYAGAGDSGIGDRGAPGAATNPYAQDRTSPNGKILRLTLDGAGAPGNPFPDLGGAAKAVYAYGLRNPWRFTFQPGTGLLWVADVGQNTWEEVDVVHAGDNLGWPQCEAREPSPPCPGSTVPPVYQYDHHGRGASITGGVFYDAAQLGADYRGSYFFGDYVLDLIWRAVPTAANDGFKSPPEVFGRNAGAPVDFTVGPDGAIYYVAFGEGEIRKIFRAAGGAAGPDPCALRLGRAMPAFVRAAGRRIVGCSRHGRADCAGHPLPATPLARAIARRCGVPPAELCTRLGCAACAGAHDLAACAAAAGPLRDIAAATVGATAGRCSTAAFTAGVGLAAARATAVARCRTRTAARCVEADRADARLARRLARRCPVPPPALCEALDCDTCATGRELASCVGAAVASSVDGFAFRLYGSADPRLRLGSGEDPSVWRTVRRASVVPRPAELARQAWRISTRL